MAISSLFLILAILLILLALGVPEGKQVGALLQALLGEVLDGETPNERGALLARAQLFMDF